MTADEEDIIEKLKAELLERDLDVNIVIYSDWDGYLGLAAGSTKAHIKAAATSLGYQIGSEGAVIMQVPRNTPRAEIDRR